MMALKTTAWDPAKHLDSADAIAQYLNAAIEDGDPALVSAVLGDIARAKGMAKVAREAGVSRESLYRSLSKNGNPEFGTVMKVSKSLGLEIIVRAKAKRTRGAKSVA